MGMSVDIRYGMYSEIWIELRKAGAGVATDGSLLGRILEKFGTRVGDVYFILNNEHIDANPLYELGDALEAAFDPKADGRFFSVVLEHTKCGVSHADASTVCEELGIKWQDSED